MGNNKGNSINIGRRRFMAGAAAGIGAFTIAPASVLGSVNNQTAPSDKLNIAFIGVGGHGRGHVNRINELGENMVAFCDVDDRRAAEIYESFPDVPRYKDYRVMLEQKQNDIDAVIIATPDHTHAVIAMAAMQLGKHVYLQKPLTRTVWEARMLTEAARRYNVKTQMGNQGHSQEGVRLISEWIWDGAIGDVKEVVSWTNRPIWPTEMPRPTDQMPVPDGLDWDLWVGPSPMRPYHDEYLPFNWRAWKDFGTGALGDMACHIMDPAVTALKLKYPESVQVSYSMYVPRGKRRGFASGTDNESFPRASIVRYRFAAREGMPPLKYTWYDGGMMPERPEMMELGRRMGDHEGGTLFIGETSGIVCGTYGNSPRIFPETAMQAYERPPRTLPRVDGSHEADWIRACKEDDYQATSNFDYSGPFTEMVLMGNLPMLANLHNDELLWDGPNMEFTNNDQANEYVKPDYRNGWSL